MEKQKSLCGPDNYLILIKGKIPNEDMTVKKVYTPNNKKNLNKAKHPPQWNILPVPGPPLPCLPPFLQAWAHLHGSLQALAYIRHQRRHDSEVRQTGW